MSVHDLVFSEVSTGETLYDPTQINGSPKEFKVTNFGDDSLTNLGIYIVPATSVGDVDYPADFPPNTDYQDLMTWGSKTSAGVTAEGGLKLTLPQNDGTFAEYVTREVGASYRTKIPFIDLGAGDSANFTVEFETPPGQPARRFYIDLRLE